MSRFYLQANYQVSYFFRLPNNMCLCDLNDKTKVKEYYISYNALHIIFADGSDTSIGPKGKWTIKPEDNREFYEQFYKKPDTWFPIVKVDNELFYNEPVNHSDDDEIHCRHKDDSDDEYDSDDP